MQTNPLNAIHIRKTFQQFRKISLFINIKTVVSQVLCNQDKLFRSLCSKQVFDDSQLLPSEWIRACLSSKESHKKNKDDHTLQRFSDRHNAEEL